MNPQHIYLPIALLFVTAFAGKTWYDSAYRVGATQDTREITVLPADLTVRTGAHPPASSTLNNSYGANRNPTTAATNDRSQPRATQPSRDDDNTPVDNDAGSPPSPRMEDPESDDEALRERIDGISNAFYSQTTDENWSLQSSNQIYSYFEQMAQEENHFGSELRSVECRSSMCKVEVQHENNLAADEFFLRFPMSVGSALPNINYQFENLPDGKINVLMFLANDTSTVR